MQHWQYAHLGGTYYYKKKCNVNKKETEYIHISRVINYLKTLNRFWKPRFTFGRRVL